MRARPLCIGMADLCVWRPPPKDLAFALASWLEPLMARFQPLANPAVDGLSKPPRRGRQHVFGCGPKGVCCPQPEGRRPEGEREVWRERVENARPCMAQAPEPPSPPRAPRPTLLYTFGAGNAAVAGVLEGFSRIATPCYCSLKASLFLALGRLSLFLSLWIPFRQRNAKNK